MAIFSEIGKKITQTTQSALKSTKDLADISSLNSQISDEEKLLNSFYKQIGEKYYELYRESKDESFEALCSSITEGMDKIVNLKYEVQRIKGIKNCSGCGAEIPMDTIFCGTCGYDTRGDFTIESTEESKAATEAKKCTNCNNEVAIELAFCTNCGQKL
ncbi:MAG: zinc ribbon domain-containing protein [Tissierellales bacterium]